MLSRRILSIKMKKCYLIFLVSALLSSIIYFLPRNETKNSNNLLGTQITSRIPSEHVHIFYNASYRNKKIDGKYRQWGYNGINVEERIASAYYPSLGLYSSNDPKIIDIHMKQIRDAGIGVVVVLWWPEYFEETPPMQLLLQYAAMYGLKVTIQIQDYKGRSIVSIRKDLYYFYTKYSEHPGFYKTKNFKNNKVMPLIYIYNSFLISNSNWHKLLGHTSATSVRGTNLDAIFIALTVEEIDRFIILHGDFDGFYTYFVPNGFTYGSTWHHWPYMEDFAKEHNLIFIPTVGPGYSYRSNKNKISNSTNRIDGAYYASSWTRAIISRSRFISINSFNGWREGTQIEPAQPKTFIYEEEQFKYYDYEPSSPDYYLSMTNSWINEFVKRAIIRGYYY